MKIVERVDPAPERREETPFPGHDLQDPARRADDGAAGVHFARWGLAGDVGIDSERALGAVIDSSDHGLAPQRKQVSAFGIDMRQSRVPFTHLELGAVSIESERM